ncbi:MAG: hypothetical protein ACOCTG_03565 [Bacteroidota bacterium]
MTSSTKALALFALPALLLLSACDRHEDEEEHFHGVDRVEVRERGSANLLGIWREGQSNFDGDGLHLHDGEGVALDVLFFDDDNRQAPLGAGREYSLQVEYSTQDGQVGQEGVVAFSVHGDHVDIEAVDHGETWIVFSLWHGSHADFTSPPFHVEVDDH